jgi:AcrR family transcriptional regulator
LYKHPQHFDTFPPERFKYYGLAAGGVAHRPERKTTAAAGCHNGLSGEVATAAKRGRPASASRDDVLRTVAEQYVNGRRVDVTVVARRLGVSRATIYRWFGSREALIGEVVAIELERLMAAKRRLVTRRGAVGLIEVLDRTNRSIAKSTALRQLLEQEPSVAMRLLTASDGVVQPRAVACVEELIRAEASAGTFEPPAEPGALAYAIVRLAEAFLYNDVAIGIRGDHRRLRDVQAALLGVSPAALDDLPVD